MLFRSNAAVLLGRPMDELLGHLERRYNDGTRFRLHYVTARELCNAVKAAERGAQGNPAAYLQAPLTQAAPS